MIDFMGWIEKPQDVDSEYQHVWDNVMGLLDDLKISAVLNDNVYNKYEDKNTSRIILAPLIQASIPIEIGYINFITFWDEKIRLNYAPTTTKSYMRVDADYKFDLNIIYNDFEEFAPAFTQQVKEARERFKQYKLPDDLFAAWFVLSNRVINSLIRVPVEDSYSYLQSIKIPEDLIVEYLRRSVSISHVALFAYLDIAPEIAQDYVDAPNEWISTLFIPKENVSLK